MSDEQILTPAEVKALPLKERVQRLLAEYGMIAVVISLVIFCLVYAAVFIAIKAGFADGESGAGTFVAAYVITKLTMPVRIPVALLLTPFVAKILRRKKSAPEGAAG